MAWEGIASFPGLPTVQFLIAYSVQKWRGKTWSILSHERCQYLPRGGRVPHRKNKLEALSCSFCPKHWSFQSSQSEKRTLLKAKNPCAKCVILIGNPSPPLVDTDVTRVIKWTRPFPATFAYCKQSKTGCWELGSKRSNSNQRLLNYSRLPT